MNGKRAGNIRALRTWSEKTWNICAFVNGREPGISALSKQRWPGISAPYERKRVGNIRVLRTEKGWEYPCLCEWKRAGNIRALGVEKSRKQQPRISVL